MANPTQYTRQYNFRNYQTDNPTDPLPGVQVDVELNAVKASLDSLRTSVVDVRRSDGSLQNASVTADSLDESALTLIGSEGFNVRGIWVTATLYAVGDLVRNTATGVTTTYVCATEHTSGTFATDYTAGKWVDLTSARASGLITYDNAVSGLTATDVKSALDEIDAKVDLVTVPGSLVPYAGLTAPSGWLLCYGQAVSRTTYSTLFAAVSVSQSGTRDGSAVITGLSSTTGFVAGMPVSGAGVPSSTTILTVDSATQITLSQNTSSSGTSTVVVAPWGIGDGSTTFEVPDLRGRSPFGRDDMGGSAASRLTSAVSSVVGTRVGGTGGSQALQTHTHTVGTRASMSAGTTDSIMLGNAAANATHTSSAPSGTTGSSGNIPPAAVVNWLIKT
jgi:microcystin-dependent protein